MRLVMGCRSGGCAVGSWWQEGVTGKAVRAGGGPPQGATVRCIVARRSVCPGANLSRRRRSPPEGRKTCRMRRLRRVGNPESWGNGEEWQLKKRYTRTCKGDQFATIWQLKAFSVGKKREP